MLRDFDKGLVEDDNAVPFGLFPPLAGLLVPPALRGRNPHVADRGPGLGVLDLRVRAQPAEQNDFVNSCHGLLLLALSPAVYDLLDRGLVLPEPAQRLQRMEHV